MAPYLKLFTKHNQLDNPTTKIFYDSLQKYCPDFETIFTAKWDTIWNWYILEIDLSKKAIYYVGQKFRITIIQ